MFCAFVNQSIVKDFSLFSDFLFAEVALYDCVFCYEIVPV